MKVAISSIVFAVLAATFWLRAYSAGPQADITSKVLVSHVMPFGVNLGIWTAWGSEQLSSNIVKNPGFEGIVDRSIVIPLHVGPDNFDDSPAWMARADSFWDGSHYDLRTGPAAGTSGTVSHSLQRNLFGLPAFIVKDQAALPFPGDAVSLTRESDTELPAQWWFNGAVNSFAPDLDQARPGSPGKRSLKITGQLGQKAEVISYFDSISERAGKLLPLGGHWELSFWSRLSAGSASLHVQFGRDGASALLSKDVPVSSSWTNQRLLFEGADDGPDKFAALHFQVSSGSQGQISLDDVDLHRVSDADGPFRHEVTAVLEDLHPRYLRDWEGQLGDTLANRTASAFARKSFRYRPGDAYQSEFGYGLGDFLELCLKVRANPWIIVPTTFSDEECAGLGTYLENYPKRSQFSEVLTEFGNENCNEVFRAAGIPDPHTHGQAADRCFAALRQHAASIPLKTVVNAQHVNTGTALQYAKESQTADIEAIAPYFLYSMEEGTPPETYLPQLFAGDGGALKRIAKTMPGLKKDLAVYEVNLTTVGGSASGAQRTPVVAGRATAAALAKTMLDALALGARRQCAYALSGFDSKLPGDQGYVPLWGLTRDLGPTSRLRPTGLALKLLNQIVDGDMLEVNTHGLAGVSVYAFHSERGWATAIVSGRDTPLRFDLQFADDLSGRLPDRVLSVFSKSWNATNEESQNVSIASAPVVAEGRKISFEIEPWTLAVLLPGEGKR